MFYTVFDVAESLQKGDIVTIKSLSGDIVGTIPNEDGELWMMFWEDVRQWAKRSISSGVQFFIGDNLCAEYR